MKETFLTFILIALVSAPMLSAGVAQAVDAVEVYPSENPEVAVDTDWLAAHLAEDGLIVIDFRKSRRAYLKMHVPGAIHIGRDAVLGRVDGVPYMLTPVEELIPLLGKSGIANEKTVIVYDEGNGLWAARFFWTLEYLGHADVRVLNGGWKKWQYEELPTSSGSEQPETAVFEPRIYGDRIVDMEWLINHFADDGVFVMDVRSPAEYEGTDVQALRTGHVPEAENKDWVNAVTTGPINVLKSQDKLKEIYSHLPLSEAEKIVTYCHWGVRAAHTYFTLRYLGYENVRVYDGSWIEWGNKFFTPIEK